MPNLTPPQLPLTWGHTPKEVTDSIKGFIVQDKETYDKVGSLPQDMCNFESVRSLQFVYTTAKNDCSTVSNSD